MKFWVEKSGRYKSFVVTARSTFPQILDLDLKILRGFCEEKYNIMS